MKGLDIFIVRFLPFVLFIMFGINLLCLWKHIDIFNLYELHGNSALYASAMFAISFCNKRYHCIWNRAMYIFLIVIPIINFFDSVFTIMPTERAYLIIIHVLYIITAIYTSIMAVKHFMQQSIKRTKNGNNNAKVRL